VEKYNLLISEDTSGQGQVSFDDVEKGMFPWETSKNGKYISILQFLYLLCIP